MAKVQNLHLQKEARRLLEDKVANMPLDTEKRLISISNSIEAALQKKDVKIKRLINWILCWDFPLRVWHLHFQPGE